MAGNFYSWVKDERVLKNPSAKCTSPHPESCPYHGTKKLDKTDEVDKGAGGGVDDVAKMDAAYADAVKRGDRETALRMIREAAAKAMPNTKVVDKDGLPHVCYHATENDFSVFDPYWDDVSNSHNPESARGLIYFATTKEGAIRARGDKIIKACFINASNIKGQGGPGIYWGSAESPKYIEKCKQSGFDAIRVRDEGHGTIAAFYPSQIKSADIEYDDDGNLIPLSKRFDDGDDIRGDVGKKADVEKSPMDDDAEMDRQYEAAVKRGDTETCATMVKARAKKMMPNTKVVDENGDPKVVYHIGTLGGRGHWKPSVDGSTSPDNSLGIHFGTKNAAMDRARRFLNDDQVVVEKNADGKFDWRTDAQWLDWMNENRRGGFDTEDDAKIEALHHLRDMNLTKAFVNLTNPKVGKDKDAQIYKPLDSGYDGVSYQNEYEDKGSDSFLAMKTTQVKSADPITYDDNGAVIPLSKRFDFKNPDIRY